MAGRPQLAGAAMELALLSLLHHAVFQKRRETGTVRVVGLSGASLAPESAEDLARWLGVRAWSRPNARSLWNFGNGVRPVPQELLVKKFEEKLSTPRLAAMNKPCFQALVDNRESAGGGRQGDLRQSIIFVSSPRQAWLTAQALISLSMMGMGQSSNGGSGSGGGWTFVSDELRDALDDVLRSGRGGSKKGGRHHKQAVGETLSQSLRWGFGLHYSGMAAHDATLVESLWQSGLLKVLIATPELAWNFPSQASCGLVAPLVVIKGTTRAMPGGQRGEQAYSQPEMLQMIGRACWDTDNDQSDQTSTPAWDDSPPAPPRKARVVVLCQDILKDYWVTALFCPMALESSLHQLPEAAATEAGQALVLSGFIAPNSKGEGDSNRDLDSAAVEALLQASFLARRVQSNPNFYSAGAGADGAASSANARHLLLKRERELAERA